MNRQSKPQGGETRRNPWDGISGNIKSQRRSELAPNWINSEVPAGKFQRRFEFSPKGIIPRRQQNQRGIPDKEYLGIFIPKGYLIWRQKETNPEVPAGQFLRSVQFIRRYQLAPKGNNSKVPAGEFCVSGKVLRSVRFLRRSKSRASGKIST